MKYQVKKVSSYRVKVNGLCSRSESNRLGELSTVDNGIDERDMAEDVKEDGREVVEDNTDNPLYIGSALGERVG